MIGRTLGNYRLIEQIGMGGMATVYKAYDPDTDRYVAIKVLPEHFSQDPKFRQRFEREARAIAKLEHIHILPLFAYGEEGGTAYMVMRYLRAGSLTDRIRTGALSLPEASRLLSQVASALDHAHSHGVLHRDVKPSNILLDADGNAFLTDFGIAKMVESTLDLTGGGILGTPAYMSPEQCRGNQELTPASDQYSLGIILYEMITGRTPFQAETPIALIHMQLNDPLPMPHQVRADIPEDAERVILKALTKDPNLRFSTCGAMAAAFARAVAQIPAEQPAVEDLTVAAEAPSAPTAAVVEDATVLHGAAGQAAAAPKPWSRLPGWMWGVVGAVMVVVLLAAAIVVGQSLFGEDEEPTAAEVRLTPATRAEATVESIPTPPEQPSAEEPSTISGPIPLGEPPPGIKEVRPCDWQGHGSGLCIYEPAKERPIRKIVQGQDLEFPGMASWSPDGTRIAFTAVESGGRHDRDMTIYVVDADGRNLVELPQLANDLNPAWSPDGQWLTFHSGCDLGVVHPDGSAPNVLWQHEVDKCVEQPQWSPDSQSIVVSIRTGGGREIFPVTREIWVVTDDAETFIPIATVTYQNNNCMMSDVAFSPDGKQVAYIDNECRAWLASADGSGQPELLSDFPYWWLASAYPQWGQAPLAKPPAPEPPAPKMAGKWVDLCPDIKPPHICVFDDKTGKKTQLTADLTFETIGGPGWSPDGRQIVFEAGSDPQRSQQYDHKLYVINADGSGLTQITHGDTNDASPAWSPDGEWIAFHRNCSLGVVRPDGAEAKILLERSEILCAGSIAWSPDSRQISFWNGSDKATQGELWLIDRDGGNPHVVYTYEPIFWPWVTLWSPDGRQVGFWYHENDQPHIVLVNADGSGEPQSINDQTVIDQRQLAHWLYPYWPQWAGETGAMVPPEEVFYEGFDGAALDPAHWEMEGRLRLVDGRVWFERDGRAGPWDSRLRARLSAPVKRIEFVIGLEAAAGNTVGFGIDFWDQATEKHGAVWLNSAGGVPMGQNGQVMREIKSPASALPVEYTMVLEWTEGATLIYVDDELAGQLPAQDFAREISFWGHLGSNESMRGYFDEIRLTYAGPDEKFVASAAPPAPEPPPPKPAGKWVETCPDTEPPQICVYDNVTDQRMQLTTDLTSESKGGSSWSPDGQQIVFEAGSNPERSQQYDHKLFAINADGSGLTQITRGDSNDVSPAWSPDGEWIAFHRNCGLAVVRPDGSDARILLENSDNLCAGSIAWSPDSRQISFWNGSDKVTQGELWLIDRDGGNPHVVYTYEPIFWPWITLWSPDGRQVGFWYHENDQPHIVLVNADGSGEPQFIDDQTVIDQKQMAHWSSSYWPQWDRQ